MNTREIRVVTHQEQDRSQLVEMIERLGHHVVDGNRVSDRAGVDAVIVVDFTDGDPDLGEITAELSDHSGPVVLITNRSGNELDALTPSPSTMVVVGDDPALGYDIAFRICEALQTGSAQAVTV
jgi:hypothetical protein